jgi:hypothetical protein
MSKLTKENCWKLTEKYKDGFFAKFETMCEERGYSINGEIDEEGIWDEVLCKVLDKHIIEDIIVGIEDSISLEEYGFVDEDEE